jgi:anti-sigma B factor antagonist
MTLPTPSNVLPLQGEIDLNASPALGSSLNTMIAQQPARLVVDLTQVDYIDSSGLAALIHGMQRVESYGGRFMLAGLKDEVRTLFETAGLGQVFLIFPHVDAALAAT